MRRNLQACAKKTTTTNTLLAPRYAYDNPNSVVLTEGSLGPSPGAHARNAETKLPFPSWIVTGKPSMKRRRNGDSDFDGDLVDPSVGAPEPPPTTSPSSQPNPHHGPVYVGGGEREARAYVPPMVLPSIAAPKTTADKVAISSSIDPRRMQTMRIAPGQLRPPLSPDEQRPQVIAEEAGATPSNRYPTAGPRSSPRGPKSAMASATIARAPTSAPANNNNLPTIVWVLAVALAALIGAGTALWLRKTSVSPAPAPMSVPDKPAPPGKH